MKGSNMLDDFITKVQVEELYDEVQLKEMELFHAWIESVPWEDQPEPLAESSCLVQPQALE
jgi:hypothetical protein